MRSGAPILERSLYCLMPMLGGSPLHWEIVRLRVKAPVSVPGRDLLREYPRLSQLIREEMGH